MQYLFSISFLVYCPILSAFLILIGSVIIPKISVSLAKLISILTSITLIILSIRLLMHFDRTLKDLQFVERYLSIPKIGFEVFFAVDGLSMYFVILTGIVSFVATVYHVYTVKENISKFLFCNLLLASFCIGVFVSINLLSFYFFFELVLVPLYLMIGIWGGSDKIYASLKFFLYSFFGALLFLISIIFIYVNLDTLSIIDLYSLIDNFSSSVQKMLWIFMFLSFVIKLPLVPFHTWLADAHVQAPTAGSIMLAGVLLKLGGYALIRILLPMFPEVSCLYSKYIICLSGFTVVYGALVAFNNTDIKKIIAYSSVSHMGYVAGGVFSITFDGIKGSIFQMVSHGLISSALFLIIGILYHRNKNRLLDSFGGVAVVMPNLSLYFKLAMFGSIALPGTSGFIGEFFSILGIYQESIFAGVLAALGIILGPIYMLNLYKKVMLGNFNKSHNFQDLFTYEKFLLILLISLIYLLGIVPNIVFNVIYAYISNLMNFFEVV